VSLSTEPTSDQPVPASVVRADPDTRLDQLLAEYATVKPIADEYAAKIKGITDGIKAELVTLHPDQREITVVGSVLADPLRLEAVQKWGLDTKRLKTEKPDIYVRYAKQRTEWRLCRVKPS
jgi:predicted phage-related endonuclease